MVQQIAVGSRLRLQLEGWGRLGEALAHHEGQMVFVFGGIPGEEVEVEVIRRWRHYTAARVVKVLSASPRRVSPPCSYFGLCTGCQLQHIDYTYTLEMKREIVVDAIVRVGGIANPLVMDTIASPNEYGYRNHARFTIGPEGSLGFVNRESRQFVSVEKCLLMDDWINGALEQLQGLCSETTQLSVRYGIDTGEYLVQPTLKNENIPLASGQKYYMDSLNGRAFRVASPSFFQVNIPQAGRMVEEVKNALCLSGDELVVDVYAGVGTFAIMLAPHCRKVIAIEESRAAVDDTRVNASGIGNLEIWQARAEKALSEMQERPDGVVLDPPRVGCHADVLIALAKLKPKRVVYISCDPTTMARDLKVICPYGFRLDSVQPIDMFPQTRHVECIATLSFDENYQPPQLSAQPLVLASTSPRRHELMASLGLKFQRVPPSTDEEPISGESPESLVERLALEKARSVAGTFGEGLVVGADSVVVVNGSILGKPDTTTCAREVLIGLRGITHQVISGVAVVDASTGQSAVESCLTNVTMRQYSDQEVDAYISTGGPMDKAGAYGIQDDTFGPASYIEGCYSNVVGLPICTLIKLLAQMGCSQNWMVSGQTTQNCSNCPLTEGIR
jgi:23S rRNA (uracil1939-C5)-methyltransferase